MRILHVSDFHYHHPWFDWLAAQAADYDAACLTGDLLDMLRLATTDGLRPQSKWVRGWLATWPAKTLLFVCSGNHDWWPKGEDVVDNDTEGGWLKKARRPNVVFGGWRHHPARRIPYCLHALGAQTRDSCGVPVSRPLPRPARRYSGFCRFGSGSRRPEVLQAAWALPRGSLILSGHIHNPRRWYARVNDTWCFNPATTRMQKHRTTSSSIYLHARRASMAGAMISGPFTCP